MTGTKAPIRCLVADDEPLIGALLQDALARHGFATHLAADGRAASRKLTEQPYGVVVTDVLMPLKTGVELVRDMRVRGQDIPTLLMSSFLSEEVLQSCKRLQQLAFLQKPFSLS
jgi:two-component system response regulator QseB